MSQSDYIRYKKTQTVLLAQNSDNLSTSVRKGPQNTLYKNLPNVLNQKDYIQYKQFSLVNTILKNTNPTVVQYTDPNKNIVWDMLKKTYQVPIDNPLPPNLGLLDTGETETDNTEPDTAGGGGGVVTNLSSICPPPFPVCRNTHTRNNRDPIKNPSQIGLC